MEMARDGEGGARRRDGRRVPDLILSDTRLQTPPTVTSPLVPRDGYDFCERLKANEAWARVPFMFPDGLGGPQRQDPGLRLGVGDYPTKPIYLKELLTRVQLVLARRRRESLTATTRASFAGELGAWSLSTCSPPSTRAQDRGHRDRRRPERGALTFRDGRVVDAATSLLRGERAVYRMLRWNDGSFTARFGANTPGGRRGQPHRHRRHPGPHARRPPPRRMSGTTSSPPSRRSTPPGEVDREAPARAPRRRARSAGLARRAGRRPHVPASLLEACNDDLAALARRDVCATGIPRAAGRPLEGGRP